jgi:hypothetical protein
MPYSAKQMKLFRAAAHDKGIAKSSGIPMHMARKMMNEGKRAKKPIPVKRHAMS